MVYGLGVCDGLFLHSAGRDLLCQQTQARYIGKQSMGHCFGHSMAHPQLRPFSARVDSTGEQSRPVAGQSETAARFHRARNKNICISSIESVIASAKQVVTKHINHLYLYSTVG